MNQFKRSRWAWQVGSLFGISIRIHVTLFALLVWIAIATPISGVGTQQSFAQWSLVVAVFACILAHELSHALVARRFGCSTREILLLPIGGIAQMERMPQRPAQELLVAIVGPATNLAIAAVLGATIWIAGWSVGPEQPAFLRALLVPLFWSNVALAAFNLVPAFPMDGGRILRAVMATRLTRLRATRIATVVGKLLAAAFVLGGLGGGHVMLTVIGLFVWFAAERESATVTLSTLLSKSTVADAMIKQPHVVDVDTSIERAVERMLAEGQRELAVADHGRITGVVTVADLSERVAAAPPHGSVGAAMHRDLLVVEPTTALDTVLEPIEKRGAVLVGDEQAIVGLLTGEQLATFAALHRSSL